ncbi:MAG TPA: hypothetical protein VGF48_23740 [Thermoanaerobaculia bacterium]
MNEQTGAAWHPGRAAIEGGAIVIRLAARAAPPPDDLLARRASTFTITAVDGGGRSRRFPHATYVPEKSDERTFIFR